ncbi:FtsX-like permease family protein [Microbacterium sp. NPDC057650]|uniref:FtsX-like permease family protein n=1 Tax=unclassified Microbacterium TaxID=2609290 RepID=UPI00366F1E83
MFREAGSEASARASGWARWKVAARLARRQARRALGSSVLIVLLIALPVAGLATAATLATSQIPTADQYLDAQLGKTKTRLNIVSGPDPSLHQAPVDPTWWSVDVDAETGEPTHAVEEPLDDVAPLLPAGTVTLRIDPATVFISTKAGTASVSALVGPAGDPAFAGRYDVVAGRSPANAGEVLVTRSTLDSVGAGIGDDLQLRDPDRTFTITGIVDIVDQPDSTRTVVLPDAEPGELLGQPAWYLPDDALTWEQIQQLNTQGVTALSRTVALDPPITGTDMDAAQLVNPWSILSGVLIGGSIVTAFVAYQIALLAGAAFSVSARRQQRALAMAASVGATKRDLRRIVILQGLVLGGLGAALGIVLGLAGAWAAMHVLDDGNSTVYWSFAPLPWLLAAIAALAVVVGTASALLPARSAAKVDVLAMLRGARRPQRAKRSRPIWSMVLIITGVAITAVSVAAILWVRTSADGGAPIRSDDIRAIAPQIGIFAGPILAQIGVIVGGHWLLTQLSRPISRIGLAPRLAVRDAAANGTRSAAALGSIGAAVMLATFIVGAISLAVGTQAHDYSPPAPVGSLFVEVYGTGEEPPSDARVQRAEGIVEAQSPTSTAILRQPLNASPIPEADRADEDVALAVPGKPVRCTGDENGSIDDACRHLLDLTQGLYVTTAESLPALLGRTPSELEIQTFRNGGAVVFDEDLLASDGKSRIGFWNAEQAYKDGGPVSWNEGDNVQMGEGAVLELTSPEHIETLDAVLVKTPDQYRYTTLISEKTAAELGIETGFVSFVAAFDEPADEQMVEAINGASGIDAGISAQAITGPPSPVLGILLVLGATGILMLGTSAIVLGLARIDGAADDATLAAVGATPGLRRGISFWQGLIIALLGSLTGAAAGLLPIWGLIATSPYMYAEDIPWWAIVAIAVGLPLLVAAANALTSRRRPVVTRRTAIA